MSVNIVVTKCFKCRQPAYAFERISYMDMFFHEQCLRCEMCKAVLTLGTLNMLDMMLLCPRHFKIKKKKMEKVPLANREIKDEEKFRIQNLLGINKDIFIKIIKSLKIQDQLSIPLVCKTWYIMFFSVPLDLKITARNREFMFRFLEKPRYGSSFNLTISDNEVHPPSALWKRLARFLDTQHPILSLRAHFHNSENSLWIHSLIKSMGHNTNLRKLTLESYVNLDIETPTLCQYLQANSNLVSLQLNNCISNQETLLQHLITTKQPRLQNLVISNPKSFSSPEEESKALIELLSVPEFNWESLVLQQRLVVPIFETLCIAPSVSKLQVLWLFNIELHLLSSGELIEKFFERFHPVLTVFGLTRTGKGVFLDQQVVVALSEGLMKAKKLHTFIFHGFSLIEDQDRILKGVFEVHPNLKGMTTFFSDSQCNFKYAKKMLRRRKNAPTLDFLHF
eukprot:TRINITY_DN11721_c0_g1_i1.p1 TRINITY_DN11721_c0_g1~~TRINITY_DN11721_c0_g1_i1.p1  ORF type:complete len:451 (+),score=91.98 TRINITY_DN11721_c0_g1_i1:43-1395(+)